MDIAALSILMKQGQVSQQVSLAVMDKAMENSQISVEALLKVLEQSVTPHLGQSVDIRL